MNGTGKSNIIDAFLYVLGENRAHNLRIRRYVDLIRVNAASAEGSTPAAKSCVVKLKLRKGTDTLLFERSTNSDGLSTYKMDGMTISFNQYLEDLRVIGANTAVQNYFILQGNIQDVASMSDKAMTIFLERISGSIEYKKEHERYMKLHSEAVEVVLRNEQQRIA
ncbi:structural maintenance of chromosomes protein 1-like [Atheta coriaria]|uniref:structural maintenance of chromosomes protein 1-like n=1 Tax=Dalotia coriaria TaxID=877792 RepID=UPI0031F3A621